MRSKKILALLCTGVLVVFSAAASAVEFNQVQVDKSRLSFVYKQMGVSLDGRFGQFDAVLQFDPAKPQAAKVGVDLHLGSVDAGNDEATDEVAGKLWFNTKVFPKATFVAKELRALGGTRFEARGPLTIKGRSHDIVVPFTFVASGNGASSSGVADGAFTLRRSDYGLGEGIWADTATVANDIKVSFHFLAVAKK